MVLTFQVYVPSILVVCPSFLSFAWRRCPYQTFQRWRTLVPSLWLHHQLTEVYWRPMPQKGNILFKNSYCRCVQLKRFSKVLKYFLFCHCFNLTGCDMGSILRDCWWKTQWFHWLDPVWAWEVIYLLCIFHITYSQVLPFSCWLTGS